MKVYVVCWFGIEVGVPILKAVTVSPVSALSIPDDGPIVPMDVLSAVADDLLKAIDSLVDTCKQHRHLLWLLPHLTPAKVRVQFPKDRECGS